MKILVIEDDVVAGRYWVDVLKREDYSGQVPRGGKSNPSWREGSRISV